MNLLKRFASSDLKQLLRASSWTAAGSVATSGGYLLEIMVLARYLPPELLGTYFLILSFPELVLQVLDVRVKDLMTRYLGLFWGLGKPRQAVALIKLLWLVDVGIAAVALAIVVALSPIASLILLGDTMPASLMRLYAIGMFFESLDSASGSILRVFNRFELAFWGGSGIAVVRLALMVSVAIFGGGLPGLVVSRVLANVASTLVLGILSLKVARKHLGPHFGAGIAELGEWKRQLFHTALHINVSSTAKAIAMKLDVIVVGLLVGPASSAVYKLATQFAKTLLLVADPLASAIYPQFTLLYARLGLRRVDALTRRVTILACIAALGVCLAVSVQSQRLVIIFAGPQYRGAETVFVLAIWPLAVASAFFWLRPYLLTIGMERALTKSHIIAAPIGLVSIAVLTAWKGVAGSVIGFGLIYWVAIAVGLLAVVRERRRPTEHAIATYHGDTLAREDQ